MTNIQIALESSDKYLQYQYVRLICDSVTIVLLTVIVTLGIYKIITKIEDSSK